MRLLYKPISHHDKDFDFPSRFHLWLKINGCWPTDGDVNSFWYRLQDRLYTCWAWFVIGSLTTTKIGEFMFLARNIGDVKKAVENMCTSVIAVTVWLRLVHMRYYITSFKELLTIFADKIWIKRESHPLIFDRCIKRTLPTFYLSFALWTVLAIYTAQPIFVLLTTDQTMASTDKSFPYTMVLPYDLQKYWNYILTYIATTYTSCIIVSQFYAMDALIALFISFLAGQFDILHGSIARLIPECHVEWLRRNGGVDAGKDPMKLRQLQDIYTNRLHELAGHHDDLIRICTELQKFISIPLMVNVVTSTFQICANSVQFLIGGTNSLGDFMRFFLFFLSVTGQLFVVCNMGTVLITRSVDTARYLFQCNWEGGRISKDSPLILRPEEMELEALRSKLPLWKHIEYYPTNTDFQHKLRLMIMRSHRPVQFSAMKFTILSLESFSRIMSSSMSYFALLKQFLDKQE